MDPARPGLTGRELPTRLTRLLEPRSIAVVGASDRPGSFGWRMASEVLRSPARPTVYLVHPTHPTVQGRDTLRSLSDVPGAVDLVLLGVPDAALVEQVGLARERADGGVVVFGSAAGLAAQLTAAAGDLALCGAGCMGFVNLTKGIRAIGYVERASLPAGGIALVTHSGSVFSAMLRTHRRLEFSLAVSSGQELVTTTADYLAYALGLPETRVVGLFLETLRDVPLLRSQLSVAADRGIPVVALTVGGSPVGSALVTAHSGALAGDDAAWEALFEAHGVHRATGLDEFVDLLELFSIGRRPRSATARGLATVHDSGAERVLVADTAQSVGVPFAPLDEATKATLGPLLGPGLEATNPLDVWSTGADTRDLFTECLAALAADDGVGAVALAVDLVPEYDGDTSYPDAIRAALDRTDKPLVVLANLASAIDQTTAGRLRADGIPVLEGTRSGLRALAALLAHPRPAVVELVVVDGARRDRWLARLSSGPLGPVGALELVADYGIATAPGLLVESGEAAARAARQLGFPVVLKTGDLGVAHKVDVGGVLLSLRDEGAVRAAYRALADRLGPEVLVQHQIEPGVEVCVGLMHDRLVGPMVLVAPGGSLVEVVGHRRLGLPPLDLVRARAMLEDPLLTRLLSNPRGPSANQTSVLDAMVAMSQLAVELGEALLAVDINPLVLGVAGAVAVDALVVPR